MLQILEVTLKRGGAAVFDTLDLTIHPGHKVGIVGRNGAGKTTLFELIRGRLLPEEGDVKLPRAWQIAWLEQDIEPSDRSALDFTIDGDVRLRAVERAMAKAESAEDHHKLATLYAEFEDAGGYDAEARAGEILHGLGFAGDFDKPHRAFSGGWRIRLNLARTLMTPSDLMLLDEPTNHLDLDATLWLESWLARYPGTLLTIAHDRDFLDNIAGEIVHLSAGKARLYSGNYASFERQRAEALVHQSASHKRQQLEVERIQKFISRFRAQATKAKQVQSRMKALDRMEKIAPVHAESPYRFSFSNPRRASNPLIAMDNVSIGYQDDSVLHDVTLRVYPGNRIGILGVNGAGKSTLLKTLAGELAPTSGQLERGRHASVSYFAQHQMESLNSSASPLEHILEHNGIPEQRARDYLGGWGFSGDNVKRPIRFFSGGEKARLVLALIARGEPALLLLDEPTNHLDIEMRAALALALLEYQGALLIVSHDRHLLRQCVDDFWIVDNGTVAPFDDDLDAYTEIRQANETRKSSHARQKTRRAEALRREATKPLRTRLKVVEREIDRLTRALQEFETQLTDTSLYEAPRSADLTELLLRQGKARQRLDDTETEWLDVQTKLEALN